MTALRRTLPLAARARRRMQGVGLVETMVGILIGMIVILVVYNILSVSENYRRATVGASDAQINGLLTQLVAGRDAGNGGAGLTISNGDLVNCIFNEAGQDVRGPLITWKDLDAAVRPIPLLINDGGNAWTSDSFIAMFGGGSHVMWPVDLAAPFPAAGALITVQSPNGFTVPAPTAVTPYWGVIMANESAGPNVGRCKMVKVVAATVADPFGKVGLTQDPSTATLNAYTANGPARFLNLGPAGQATRILYEVDYAAPTYRGVLQTTDLLTTNALVTNPVTQNIVLMKVQYGVDTDAIPDGIVDCWTAANNANACGDGKDYSVDGPAGVRHMPLVDLNRILAVRIGVVVRSDEPDLRLLTDPTNTDLQKESAGIMQATRPQPYLFNCSANTNAACQGRVKVPMGAGGGAANCGNNVICDYWRYRTYETVIPLRNAIFSATLPP